MDGANGGRALADGPGDALDGAKPHVAGREHAGQTRLEGQGWAGQQPRAPGNVAAGQDESTIVHLDEVAEPLCARLGADHHEHGRGGDLFTLAGPDILERQAFKADSAVAVGNSGAEPEFYVGSRLQLGDELVGHAGRQRLAPDEHRDPGGEFGQVKGGLAG